MFSTTFRYALISLLELSHSDALIQSSLIARKFDLSPHYLAVVLRDLRKLGLVDSQKGNKGGYRLLRSPQQISLLELYRSLAGSNEANGEQAVNTSAELNRADAWLQTIGGRWSDELAATTLADLQQWSEERGQP